MNAIINNIKRLFFQHITANLLILLNITLSTAAIFVLLQNYYFLRQQYREVYGTTDIAHNYTYVLDFSQRQNYSNDLLNKSPMYYVGKQVMEELENKYGILFYSNIGGYLETQYFDDSINWQEFSIYDEENRFEYIEAHYLSSNAFIAQDIKLSEGEYFTESDYENENIQIPLSVIMGNDFANYFKIGDTFSYNGDTAKIIGFLDKGSRLSEYGIYYSLDSSMLFPQYFSRLEYEDYCFPEDYSYIYCGDESIDVQDVVNTITTQCGYYTLNLNPMDGIQISSTKDISEKNVKLIGILALIACIICALSLSSILLNRTLQDCDIYCIYLCCGIPMWKINLSIALEMIAYLVLSIFPTIAISIREYDTILVPWWQIILFAGTITMISLIPTFIANRKCNIDLLIRDKTM